MNKARHSCKICGSKVKWVQGVEGPYLIDLPGMTMHKCPPKPPGLIFKSAKKNETTPPWEDEQPAHLATQKNENKIPEQKGITIEDLDEKLDAIMELMVLLIKRKEPL